VGLAIFLTSFADDGDRAEHFGPSSQMRAPKLSSRASFESTKHLLGSFSAAWIILMRASLPPVASATLYGPMRHAPRARAHRDEHSARRRHAPAAQLPVAEHTAPWLLMLPQGVICPLPLPPVAQPASAAAEASDANARVRANVLAALASWSSEMTRTNLALARRAGELRETCEVIDRACARAELDEQNHDTTNSDDETIIAPQPFPIGL
jgi:hypothetical protein